MNSIELVKYHRPINDFCTILFKKENSYYLQVENHKTGRFSFREKKKPKDIETIFVNECPSMDKLKKNKLIAYLREDDSYIVGFLDEIRDNLMNELFKDSLNPPARLKLAKMFRLTGLIQDLNIECTSYLRAKGIFYYPDKISDATFEDILDISKSYINNKYGLFKRFVKTEGDLKWEHFYKIENKYRTVLIGTIEVDISKFYEIISSISDSSQENQLILGTNTYVSHRLNNDATHDVAERREVSDSEKKSIIDIANKVKKCSHVTT